MPDIDSNDGAAGALYVCSFLLYTMETRTMTWIQLCKQQKLCELEITHWCHAISRLPCSFWILRMRSTTSRLCEFLDCVEQTCIHVCSLVPTLLTFKESQTWLCISYVLTFHQNCEFVQSQDCIAESRICMSFFSHFKVPFDLIVPCLCMRINTVPHCTT